MSRNTCPFLGLQEDPSTSLSFPSEGNFCHHALPVSRVRNDYQQKFCLTGNHINCPVYRSQQLVPLPADLLAAPLSRTSTRNKLVALGIPALVVSAAALALAWNVFGAPLGSANRIPDTGLSQSSAGALSMLPESQAITPTPGHGPTQKAQAPNCPLPAGYIPYTVNPTDSLYRLSVVYGVSVQELQQKNCMGSQTLLLPGQVIYVPDLPTSTPTPVPTPYSSMPTAMNQPASNPKPVKVVPTNTPLPPVKPTNPPPPATTDPTKPGRTWPTANPNNNDPKVKPTKENKHNRVVKPKKDRKPNPGGNGDKKPKKRR